MAGIVICEGSFLVLEKTLGGWEYCSRKNNTNAVFVAAVTNQNQMILVKEYRPPVSAQVISTPAGLVADTSPSETILQAAARELQEEAGYTAANMQILGTYPSSAGLTSELFTIVWASGLTKTSQGGGVPGENIKVILQPIYGLVQWLNSQMVQGIMVQPQIEQALWLARANRLISGCVR